MVPTSIQPFLDILTDLPHIPIRRPTQLPTWTLYTLYMHVPSSTHVSRIRLTTILRSDYAKNVTNDFKAVFEIHRYKIMPLLQPWRVKFIGRSWTKQTGRFHSTKAYILLRILGIQNAPRLLHCTCIRWRI